MLKKLCTVIVGLFLSYQIAQAVNIDNRPEIYAIKGGVAISSVTTPIPGTIRFQSNQFQGYNNNYWITFTSFTGVGVSSLAVNSVYPDAVSTGTYNNIYIPAENIISGVLSVERGGTGSGTPIGARSNLGLIIGTDVQPWNTNLDDLADGTLSASKIGSGLDASKVSNGVVSNIEFDTLDNISSNIQSQLNNKQPLNTHLTDLSDGYLTSSKIAAGPLPYDVWATSVGASSIYPAALQPGLYGISITGNAGSVTNGLYTTTNFGGDVSGTYNTIAVLDDSHNHSDSTINNNLTIIAQSGSSWNISNSITPLSIGAGNLDTDVVATKIGTNAVDTNAIQNNAVTNDKIDTVAASKITTGNLAPDVVAYALGPNVVETNNILDFAVTDDKVTNDITLDDIKQITNRSHYDLMNIGINTHFQIDTKLNSLAISSTTAALDINNLANAFNGHVAANIISFSLIAGATTNLQNNYNNEVIARRNGDNLLGAATGQLKITVDSKVNKSGDTMTGNLIVPNIFATGGTFSTINVTTLNAVNIYVSSVSYTIINSSWVQTDFIYPLLNTRIGIMGDVDMFDHRLYNSPDLFDIAISTGYLASQDALKVNKSGDTMTGDLTVPNVNIGYNINMTSSSVMNLGDVAQEGTWRFRVVNGDLAIQERINGSFVTQGIFTSKE